ncbi:ABC transporter permease [Marinomonas foliarum]|uniref:Monosaccharide ABC transporter membrane protein (CUT2 family) n=2 Tax=Gammaproteobacteria TaxID=1236 RepID=A0A368ZHD8_9GAMM|nr:ABC transporter permease [Marinomonas foliarum]RCW93029.1 monosaccharide ABC transporter membrane protein (CUT2 family) [Marinomonas foliarum]
MKRDANLWMLCVLIIVLFGFGGVVSGGTYLSLFNLQSMAMQVPEIGLLAIGVMLAMCAGNGGIDLSGIANANLSGVASGIFTLSLIDASQDPLLFTIIFVIGCMVIGLLGGILNGIVISRFGITPILGTLGTQMIFTGVAVVLSDGRSVTVGITDSLYSIGNGLIFGIPSSFILFVVIGFVLGVVLKYTPYGMRLMLTGANPKAAAYSGFPSGKIIVTTYALSGLLAGIAGVIIAARNINVKWDYGTSYLLIAILIAIMAGVRPEGGYGRVSTVILSAVVLQLLSSLLNFIGLSNFVRDLAWGALLLCFLAVGRFNLINQILASIASMRSPRATE